VRSPILPFNLASLRDSAGPVECDNVWDAFIAQYSATVLHTCRSVATERDTAMDAYAHVLESLREDGCRRLRAYAPHANVKFSSWLIVVTRRLVLDYLRHRYGRSRSEDLDRQHEQQTRRRLENLVADEIDPDQIVGDSIGPPDAAVRRQQLEHAVRDALTRLKPADRLLLALRFEDDSPVREIAATLGMPSVFHVYRRLSVVLAELRAALENKGINEAEP
jgi:RNA polymerase sigma factor (sigma-70 family)